MDYIQKIITQTEFLVAKESQNVQAPLSPAFFSQRFIDYQTSKVAVCKKLNKLVQQVNEARYSTIATVIDDRYIRLISKGILSQDINTDRLTETLH